MTHKTSLAHEEMNFQMQKLHQLQESMALVKNSLEAALKNLYQLYGIK